MSPPLRTQAELRELRLRLVEAALERIRNPPPEPPEGDPSKLTAWGRREARMTPEQHEARSAYNAKRLRDKRAAATAVRKINEERAKRIGGAND